MATADTTVRAPEAPAASTPHSSPAPTASPLDRHAPPAGPAAGASKRGTQALVLAVVGILAGLFVPIAGIILGGLAIAAALKARRAHPGGRATTALVLGVLAIVVAVVNWVATVALISQQ